MDHEQHHPRGADGASHEEPAVEQPTAGERQESDEDPAEVKNKFDFTGLRAIPVVRPGVFGVMRKFQEERQAVFPVQTHAGCVAPSRTTGSVRAGAQAAGGLGGHRSSVLRDAWRPVVPPGVFQLLRKHQEDWAKSLRRFAAGFEEQLRAGAPPNWQFGEDWPRLTMISETVEQDGIPLAWVPRSDIVVALVHAEGIEARRAILADREADILQDCFTCLDEVDTPELAEFVANARDAARAFQDQHAKPAQALATVVLDAVLRLLFAAASFSYGGIRRQLAGVWDNAPLRYMRSALVLTAIPGALEQFWPDRGDPVPVRFNRHASAHTVHAGQFTRTNALVAIMTITSLLREAQESVWCVASEGQQSASG